MSPGGLVGCGATAEMSTVWIEVAWMLFVAAVSILFVRVCVSVVPTTFLAGTAFVVSTGNVPFPTRKFPVVSIVFPVPPPTTLTVPQTAFVALVALGLVPRLV